jgi:hypothetical protein
LESSSVISHFDQLFLAKSCHYLFYSKIAILVDMKWGYRFLNSICISLKANDVEQFIIIIFGGTRD